MRIRSGTLSILSIASAAIVLAACGGSGGSSATKPIVIGTSLSLSGDFSADGQAFERGYRLWADYVNGHGGLLDGRKVRLDILSDASSPTQVVTNYQKLINVDHVDLLMGPYSTLLTVPSQRVAGRYGKVFVVGAGGGPSAFAAGLHNFFDVSLPVKDDLVPFADWVASLPAGRRPATAAFPTSNDPFTQPVVQTAQSLIAGAGVKVVYNKVFPAEVTDYKPIADQVAAAKADMVVLGSVDVPTVSAFIQAFAQDHYEPKIFVATAGPDQGAAFVNAVGKGDTEGVMVPNTWYPGFDNAASKAMVAAYVAKYGGSASDVNADVAEAYSVGQVLAQAVAATKSINDARLISYLHGGVTLSSVQGRVRFDSLGQNHEASAFAFQWQKGALVQVVPVGATGSVPIELPKPGWGG
jgi:branched-chain amino acid transport system substrate-binding protein